MISDVQVEKLIAEAVAAEQEACAKQAESMIGASRREIADAIRARSNPNKALDKGTGGGSDT